MQKALKWAAHTDVRASERARARARVACILPQIIKCGGIKKKQNEARQRGISKMPELKQCGERDVLRRKYIKR